MRHSDWGALSPRWAGISSQEIDVCGTSVHYLRADAGQAGPTHLVIHPMAGSASMLLDLIAPLRTLGPVIAPDLPGSLFGHTGSPHPRAAKAVPNARFLKAFTARLGVQDVVVHGWSMGALVAVLFADSAAERVGHLVLAAPALPGPLPAGEALFWRTLGRLGLSVGSPAARAVLRLTGRRLLGLKLRTVTDSAGRPGGHAFGGDVSWLSPEMIALLSAEVRGAQPQRLGDAVTAFASVMSALFIDQRPVHQAVAAVNVPVLLLWGDHDVLIGRSTIDDLVRRRPDWESRVFASVGHLLPLEAPSGYVEAVGEWLAAVEATS